MAQLVTGLLIAVGILPCLAFWAWMFSDMTNNDRLLRESKTNWMFVFLLLNVFGAALYYLYEYRRG
jgi:hypothetical protein